MTIAASYPAIKPSLSLDFANVGALDPRVTFTRSTTGTYYDGVTTAKAEENLLTYSQEFDNAAWTKNRVGVSANSAAAPDASTTAETMTEDTATGAHAVSQSFTVSNTTYTLSAYIKAGTGTRNVGLGIYQGSTAVKYAFNPSTGAVVGSFGTLSAVSTSTVSVGGGWYRVSITGVLPAGSGGYSIYLVSGTTESYAGDGSSSAYIWGAQLEQRSSVTAYTPTTTQPITNYIPVLQTAAAGQARFNHDVRPTLSGTGTVSGSTITLPTAFADGSAPSTSNDFYNGMAITVAGSAYTVSDYVGSTRVATLSGSPTTGSQVFSLQNPTTGEALGLLIEEQRTNLLTYSEQFDNAAWTKSNATITANTVVAPDGTLTADALISSSGTNSQNSYKTLSGIIAYANYSLSCFAKNAGQRYFTVALVSGLSAYGVATFDLVDGTVTKTGIGATSSITNCGNGWYRCVVVCAPSTTTPSVSLQLSSSGTPTYENYAATTITGDGYSGIYIWGAQLEVGAFPTSYIPTTSAQVTRNADAASMTGTNFSSWYRQDEMTAYVEASTNITSVNAVPLAFVDGSGTSAGAKNVFFEMSNTRMSLRSYPLGSNAPDAAISTPIGSVSVNLPYKIAAAYATNNTALSLSGAAALTDPSCVVNGGPDRLHIGSGAVVGTSNPLNGHIRKLAYYPQRLTDAQLQALTA